MAQAPSSVSFSKLASFSTCGEAHRRQYVEREDSSSIYTAVGNAVHTAAEVLERHFDVTDEGALDLMVRLARQELERVEGLRGLQFYGKQDADHWLKKGIPDLVGRYVAWRLEEHERGVRMDPRRTEVSLRVRLADDLPPLVGFVDHAGTDRGRLFLRDLKTGAAKPEHRTQLDLYAVAWELEHGVRPDFVTALYLKGTAASQAVYTPRLGRQAVAELLRRYVTAFEAGAFFPAGPFTGACEPCSFASTCPWGVAFHGSDSNVLL